VVWCWIALSVGPVGCLDAVLMSVKNRDPLIFFSGSVTEWVFQRSPVTEISLRDEELANDLRKRIVKHMEQEAAALVFSGKVENFNDLGCSTEWIGW
jgi:hypothetical protein